MAESNPYGFEMYRDAGKQWRWRLFAVNGRVIADSAEGYGRRADCLRCIFAVKSSDEAPIRDSLRYTQRQPSKRK